MTDELIKEFSKKQSKAKVQEFYENALSILTSALSDLQSNENNSNMNLSEKYVRIFPMGDYTNDTFIDQTGELEIVVASNNPQLILANETYLNNLRNAKTKKAKDSVSREGTLDKIIFELLNSLTNYFTKNTTLLLINDGIKIICLKEYGFRLLIRFATFDLEDKHAILYFWDPVSKGQKPINLFLYNENMDKKNEQTNGNYKRLIRIFKNIRKTILINKWSVNNDLNKYFVELILYNVPNSLMIGNDIVKVFYKSYNYIINCNILNFISFDEKRIESFNLAKINYSKINSYIHLLKKLI